MIQQSERFVPIKVNAEKEGVGLAKQFGVSGYPTILFVDSNEKVVYKIVGYQPPADFAKSMSTAASIRQNLAAYGARLDRNPKDFEALTGLAGVYAATGDVEKAAQMVDRAAAVAPPAKKGALLSAYNDTGDGFQNAGQYQKAIGYFQKAIDARFPEQTAYARISISACYFAMSQPKQAIPYLEAFLKQGKEADTYRAQAKQMLDQAKKAG